MADILDLSAEPYDPQDPVVCCDDSPAQGVSEGRPPLPVRPGPPAWYDYEYRREGTCNLVMGFAPLQGGRHVKATARRTTQDVAHCMQDVVDVHCPRATVISVVLDHLNPHTPAALEATLPPADACRLLRKWDCHYIPKHGSWLNLAEIEVAVVSTQGLGRRLGDQETVGRVVAAWETRRNAATATVDWRFTTAKARRKLRHISP
jgi:hypothetical protein